MRQTGIMSGDKRGVYIGFGANIGELLDTYARAKVVLESRLGPLRAESSVYRSRALTLDGAESQSDYINSVLMFESALPPKEILAILLETEVLFKRTREEGKRWAPRTIDLDILFIADEIVNQSDLTVPHVEAHKRDFVLSPLREIAPQLVHPVLGKTISELDASLEDRGFKRFIAPE